MKTYHSSYGCSASISDKAGGTARLIVKLSNGRKVHDKIHSTRNAARAAWRRLNA